MTECYLIIRMNLKIRLSLMLLFAGCGLCLTLVSKNAELVAKGLIMQYEQLDKSRLDKTISIVKNQFGFILLRLNSERTATILDMSYSMGTMKGWKKLKKALWRKQWSKARDEVLDSRYAQQLPNRAQRNSQIVLTGEWCPINDEVMEVSLKLIKEGEGLVLHAYRDTLNYWTIGYGHLILENDNFSQPISKQQAQNLLLSDLKKTQQRVCKEWKTRVLLEIGKYRVGVLMDMTYNLGSLNTWVKFRQALNSYHYSQAAKQISNSLYATQVGKRAERNSAIIRDGQFYTKETYP